MAGGRARSWMLLSQVVASGECSPEGILSFHDEPFFRSFRPKSLIFAVTQVLYFVRANEVRRQIQVKAIRIKKFV